MSAISIVERAVIICYQPYGAIKRWHVCVVLIVIRGQADLLCVTHLAPFGCDGNWGMMEGFVS